jgi:hypothetical protein
LFYVQFGNASFSYRVFRDEWVGRPKEPPAVYAYRENQQTNMTVYMSWNGATEVESWAIIGGKTLDTVNATLAVVQKVGFETVASVGYMPFVTLQGADKNGVVLGSSAVVASFLLKFSIEDSA